jgi:hypothetical protein
MRARRIAVGVLLVLGTLFWTGFGLGLWAERQALDTDEWVDTSAELLENEEIRTALGVALVDSLYDSASVREGLEQRLPPELDRLAAPASAALKEVARRNAPRVLGTEAALNAWRRANEAAHATLLAIVEGDETDRSLTLDLESLLREMAEGTGLPADAVDRLPPEVRTIEIARPDQLETAQSGLDLFKTVVWVLLGLAVVAFAAAIFLAADRRRTILEVGGGLMVAAIAVFAIRRLAGTAVVDALADAPNAHSIADDVWDIATSLMVDVALGSLLLGAFVLSGAWLAGPGRRALAVRRFAAPAFREHPALLRTGLGVAILLLVVWGPVPWTHRIVPILIFTVGAFLWLEWLRARTLAEFPEEDAAPKPTTTPREDATPP